jgi:hypothetical protein
VGGWVGGLIKGFNAEVKQMQRAGCRVRMGCCSPAAVAQRKSHAIADGSTARSACVLVLLPVHDNPCLVTNPGSPADFATPQIHV